MNQRQLKRKLNIKDTMTVSQFWTEFGLKLIGYLCAVIIMVIILSVTLDVSTERLSVICEWVACGMAVLWCIPIARNTWLRFRDAGYSAKVYLWLLFPVIGWVIFLVLLCTKRKPAGKK